jgi:rhodanese-related sulfurtransferase
MIKVAQLKWQKSLDVALNVALVVAALSLAIVLAQRYLYPALFNARPAKIMKGQSLSLPGLNWSKNTKTLLLFLRSDCSYCVSSNEFYQNLVKETADKGDIKLLALFPNEDQGSEKYSQGFRPLSLEARKTNFESLGVSETPIIALVDESGAVLEIWTGKLTPKNEAAVMLALGLQVIKRPENYYISEDEVKHLVNKGHTIVVDLRERDVYNQNHLSDAINIPADELPIRAINELSPSDTIVVYGDYDGDKKSNFAEITLANQGFKNVLTLKRK